MMPGRAGFPRTMNRAYDNHAGVSEVVGVILLISVTVAAMAIVATIMFSQTTPEKIPNVNFMVGTDNKAAPTLYLTHNGGDALAVGSFSVYVDGVSKAYSVAGGGSDWSLGKNLLVPLDPGQTPQKIVLVSRQTGAENAVIGSISADVSVPSVNIAPENIHQLVAKPAICINGSDPQQVLSLVLSNVSVIGDAINQSPSSVGPVIANAVGSNAIDFYKDNNVMLDYNTDNYFRFNVTKTGSSISATDFSSNPTILYPGDIVTIYFRSDTGTFKTFGLGDQLWELSAKGVDVNITHNGIPDRRDNGDIIHSWITGYQDLGSTVKIVSLNPYTSGTTLVVNGVQLINGQNSEEITITNIRPVGIGLFVLESDNNAHIVYFVGNAQSVTRNGVYVV